MKKIILLALAALLLQPVFSQSEKYTGAMKKYLAETDSAMAKADMARLTDISAAFERIGDAEKNQWLPYYYAAFTRLLVGFHYVSSQKKDQMNKTAGEVTKIEKMLNKAEENISENAELLCLWSMYYSLIIMENPMINGMKYGEKSEECLRKAKAIDANNPRIYLLEGQSAMYKPIEWGGGKELAKVLLQKSLVYFEKFKPESELHPIWGKERAAELLSSLSEK